jgi:hypothetical protein
MATIKSAVQAVSTVTPAALPTLLSTNYCMTATINHATNKPLDVEIDVTATATSPTGNKQVVIFAKGSIDGTNFGSGPETGVVNAADEANLHYVGSLPMNTSAVAQRKIFSLAAAYGGTLPLASKLVFKNDCGATLTAAAVQIAEVWGIAE